MEPILTAHTTLESRANLRKTLHSVQTLIDTLQSTRDAVASQPQLSAMHIAKLKPPVKASFDRIEEDLKEVNKGLNQYQKALKDKFKTASLPSAETGGILRRELVERAVAMHLLREGEFGVAGTFVEEVREAERLEGEMGSGEAAMLWRQEFGGDLEGMDDDCEGRSGQRNLQREFKAMYTILTALQNDHDLEPAIAWARTNSRELETRGSNLEFELARLKFVELYTSSSPDAPSDPHTGTLRALAYARSTFPSFSARYTKETSHLSGSLAFSTALPQSPYSALFTSQDSYTQVSETFTREFCGLLGLASTSPLYTAVTAGGISLPILEKVERVMAASRGQWTSVNELPVETPLPSEMQFHSIFVCPVSKEQGTDENPPMMLPCGHVIAKESLEMHARGKPRMKCPYCPGESQPREARRVYI